MTATQQIPKALWWQHHPVDYFRDALRIADKVTRENCPFVLNRGQQLVQDAINKQRRQRRPVRILILKHRQGGYSTLAQANLFHACRFNRGTYMTVSMDMDSAEHIFSISSRYYYHLPDSEKAVIQTVASNRKELKFAEPHGGRIIVETAGKTAAGHSFTLAGLHLSEVSRWPEDTEDARAGLLNSITNEPNTIIIVESVANGMSGWFYKEWHKTDSMYEKIFVPWFWQDDYKLKLPIEAARYAALLDDDERQLMSRHDLSLEQVEWRRHTLHNNLDDDLDKFKEQYPATAAEAFRASGNSFFSVKAVEAIQPVEPLRGELRETEDITGATEFIFAVNPRGPYRLWQRPQKGRQYVIAADVAEGIEIDGAPSDDRHDYSVADVLDRNTGEQVCQLHGKITPDELGRCLALLGRWYNNAFVGVESNAGYGLHVLDEMQDAEYPPDLLYRQQVIDEKTRRPTTKLGWRTTKANRKSVCSALDAALRSSALVINCFETQDELRSFVRKPDGRVEHSDGHKDDRVFSLAIANHMLEAAPPMDMRPSSSSRPVEAQTLRYKPSVRLMEAHR